MQKKGIIRLFSVFAICFFIIAYNIADIFLIKTTYPVAEEKINLPSFTPLQQQTSSSEVSSSNETVPTDIERKNDANLTTSSEKNISVSASAVKGKIIEQYISPYKAGLSYDKVYIKNSTDLSIDIKKLLTSPLSFSLKQTENPQVLIIHTHATETFMKEQSDVYTEDFESRTRDNSKNMVKIGEVVAKKLNDANIKTIHDKTQHDYPNYSGSYSRAATTICNYLKKYPSIKIVLDLHRDAVTSGNDKVKLATEINGKKAAQVMLVMGSQSGGVTNFPNWQENLKLAVRLQQKIEEKYPTLARPLMLMPKNYNESLSKGSMLIEFGTDGNTIDEAVYSAELVGNSLVSLLNELKE